MLSNVRGQAEPSHRIQNAEHQQSIIQVYTHDLTLSGGISIDVDLNPTPQPTPEPEPAPAPTPGPQNPPIFIGITGGGVPVTNPVPSSSPTYFNTADVIFLPKVPSSAKTHEWDQVQAGYAALTPLNFSSPETTEFKKFRKLAEDIAHRDR